jgi:hypothetical protein
MIFMHYRRIVSKLISFLTPVYSLTNTSKYYHFFNQRNICLKTSICDYHTSSFMFRFGPVSCTILSVSQSPTCIDKIEEVIHSGISFLCDSACVRVCMWVCVCVRARASEWVGATLTRVNTVFFNKSTEVLGLCVFVGNILRWALRSLFGLRLGFGFFVSFF